MPTDPQWQAWGETDPYFAVMTEPRFRGPNLTPARRDEFFATGRQHIEAVLASCAKYLGTVSTERSLDFGCGVGRLLVPLSEVSEVVVGVDIAEAMLAEAARNCAERARPTVRLARTLDEIPAELGRFTFVHSYIVLQHVEPRRGLGFVAELLARLDRGGCAVLHVHYARTRYRRNHGVRPLGSTLVRAVRAPLERLRRAFAQRDPEMQMNVYDLNRLLFCIQDAGFRAGGFEFTDHGGYLGVTLFVRRD